MSDAPVIAIIDVETTGANPERDRVIEFAVQKGLTAESYQKSWRVNPGIPIPPEATAVHGIRDEDVKDSPPFSALIPVVEKIIAGSNIIVGYNVDFDLRALQSEFRRAGKKNSICERRLLSIRSRSGDCANRENLKTRSKGLSEPITKKPTPPAEMLRQRLLFC